MEPRSPADSHSEMTRWMGVQEANVAGNVHGGWIMKLCDEVAGIAAIRHCGNRVVTAGEVPGIAAETDDEHRREREAQLRRTNRLAEREQIVEERGAA